MLNHRLVWLYRNTFRFGLMILIFLLVFVLPLFVLCSQQQQQTHMPAPPGYSKLIFDDQFQGTTLDTSKWYPMIGDQATFPWNNWGALPYPLSGPNSGQYEAEYYDPAQLRVNNGLTITAVPDTSRVGYTWRSGVIDTHDKFKFTSGYLQVRAQMPESRGWGTIWSLEGGCEIDTQESGYLNLGVSLANQEMTSHMPGCNGHGQFINAGVDLSAAYHIYGMRYIPGQSVTTYLDGRQVAHWTTNIPTGAMTILVSLGIGSPNASGFHTVATSHTPAPLIMKVSEVQVWQQCTTDCTTLSPTPISTNIVTPTLFGGLCCKNF